MSKLCLISYLLLYSITTFGQSESQNNLSDTTSIYPYTFPIWGQEIQNKGIDFPLPAGISVHYVYNEMYLGISEFGMALNGQDLSSILNEKTLGFQSTRATTNGINLRGDLFTLPFLNVYGLFSYVEGGTEVGLQPDFGNGKFPYFSSSVIFEAISFGVGATFNYGYKDYFVSVDANYSGTKSDLIKDNVGIMVNSIRFGKKFNLKHDRFVTFYVGAMYRNFTNSGGSYGSIVLKDAMPGLEGAYQQWYDNLSTGQRIVIDAGVKAINEIAGTEIGDGGIMNSQVDYHIKKDLLKKWTFQFGGQFQLSKRIWIRGEYGVSDYSKFILTGINYRFGV
ncbi:hypothetical protein EI427_22650 [Flammeovirga pectinis]|uniref:Uncharacterized protein n=1 Tax=Flammeovirga pectinis TaxID=2494373 RepID=A0A3Q9FUR3_9BACT|nr:hypothetical protein [Flammeovirga pectinis]AZQ65023.1 hypothetical protein EI427_22650 [Flammeovirga pectinis]